MMMSNHIKSTPQLLNNPSGNIGLFGGTFDPPHLGHLKAAKGAADELKLDQLAFIPSPQPPHKRDQTFSAYDHRRKMVELCLPEDDRFRLCLIEEQNLPGTTYETIRKLQQSGFTSEKCRLIWLMGSDSLIDLNQWHKPADLLKIVDVAIMPRPNYPIQKADTSFRRKVIVLNTPLIDLSASEIRRNRKNLEKWVTRPVADYIRENKLYGF